MKLSKEQNKTFPGRHLTLRPCLSGCNAFNKFCLLFFTSCDKFYINMFDTLWVSQNFSNFQNRFTIRREIKKKSGKKRDISVEKAGRGELSRKG